jgi:acyl carrier protein
MLYERAISEGNRMDGLAQLKGIFEAVLKVEIPDFSRDSSPTTIEEWDSVQHTNLVLAVEKAFGFEFTLEEIARLESVDDFLDVISTRLTKAA